MAHARRDLALSYVAIALVSATILLLEITLTRILSVVLWYHFAFLTVTLAMLGIGAPGVWFALRPPGDRALRWALIASGIAIPLGLVAILVGGAHLPRVTGVVSSAQDLTQARVLLTVGCILPSFLALGSAVVLLLLRATGPHFGRMYAADLLGAAGGAALAVPLMNGMPTPVLVAGCGFLPLVAILFLFRPPPRAVWAVAAALVLLVVWREPLRLRYNKTYSEPNLLWERWTPTGRITVFPKIFWKRDPAEAFGWGMGSRFTPYPIEQLWIEQDGSAGTPITRVDRPLDQLSHLFFDVTSIGYQVRVPETACVIGSGGGRDILTAFRAGARAVDAVEINGAIVEAVSGPFREFSGDVYRWPGLSAHVEEGRSFLSRTDRRWDLIQISLIDSWAATAAGAYALSENNLYTLEAMRLYLRRLSPQGLLSVSRWARAPAQFEAPRLVLLIHRALELEGIRDPQAHLAVVGGGAVATVLASRAPLGPEDLARLDAACAEHGFLRHWPIAPATPRDSFVAQVLAEGPGPLTSLGVDLSPPTDDAPFFFQMMPVLGKVDAASAKRFSLNDSTVVLLRWLMVGVGGIALCLYLLPFAARRRLPRGPGFWRGSLYFAAIGVAFLLVEVALMQRFILYLGHPSHATTVVLAAMLVGAGIGSYRAGRTPPQTVDRWRFLLPLVAGALAPLLPYLITPTLGWPFAARVGLSLAVLLPLACVMGFAFPTGMTRFDEARKAWFWAMNGVTGVFAAVTSLALAMTIGFGGVLWVGAGAYLVAACLLPKENSRSVIPPGLDSARDPGDAGV